MDVVDALIETWHNNSTPTNKSYLRTVGNLEIQLTKSARDTRMVRLNSIRSKKQQQGEATKFLKWLIEEAEKQDITITLAAQPFGWNRDEIPDKDKLKEWVERFGFEMLYTYPYDEGYEMIRYPTLKE